VGDAGTYRTLAGLKTFTIEVPATGAETLEPVLVVHGFPSSSFDFRHVVDALAEHRRVLLFDMIGYGLSAKPDRAYSVDLQADVAQAFVADAGVSTLALMTTMSATPSAASCWRVRPKAGGGGHHAARGHQRQHLHRDGASHRGQELLLSLPDERLPIPPASTAPPCRRA